MKTADQAAGQGAHERLTSALLQLAATGYRPRCGEPADHHLWTSDFLDELHEAARRCAGCPVLDPCAAAGATERWGVWGGRPAGRGDDQDDQDKDDEVAA